MTPKDYATALYRALRGQGKHEVSVGVARLMEALRARGALRLLPQVLEALPKAVDEAEAANRVTIETARELDGPALKWVARAAGAAEEAEVRQVSRPELIGGARIKTHGTTIDASVRGRLEKIRMALGRRTA